MKKAIARTFGTVERKENQGKRRTKQMNRKTVEAVHTHTHTHINPLQNRIGGQSGEREYNLIDNNRHENALFVIHARDG